MSIFYRASTNFLTIYETCFDVFCFRRIDANSIIICNSKRIKKQTCHAVVFNYVYMENLLIVIFQKRKSQISDFLTHVKTQLIQFMRRSKADFNLLVILSGWM